MKFLQKLGSLAACAALTGATLLFNVPRYSVSVKAAAQTVTLGTGKIVQVSCGAYHTLALDEFGNLWSWGLNNHGQIGNGTTVDQTIPVQIMAGHKFAKISAGENASSALDTNGYLYSWGYLNNATGVECSSPTLVSSSTTYADVLTTCYGVFTLDPSASKNQINGVTLTSLHGQLGNYSPVGSYSAAGYFALNSTSNAYFVSNSYVGGLLWNCSEIGTSRYKTCEGLVHSSWSTGGSNKYYWWGAYSFLGVTSDGALEKKEQLSGSYTSDGIGKADISSLANMSFANCSVSQNTKGIGYAITVEGDLYSFGYNDSPYNLLGNSTSSSLEESTTPLKVTASAAFSSVSSGFDHSFAIDKDGQLWGWGSNLYGQLGFSGVASETVPTLLPTFVKTTQYSFTSLIGETFSGTFAQAGATSYSVATNASKGALTIDSSTGDFSYIPNSSANGQDFAQISYVFNGVTITVNVNITIDRKPKIVSTSTSFVVPEGGNYSGVVNGVDEDGDTLVYSVSGNPAKGNVVIDQSLGKYTYTPSLGQAGNDSFTISASDGQASESITISVHIESQIVTNDTLIIAIDNTLPTTYSGNVGASDADGDVLTYSVSTNPSKGTISISTDGTYLYTPASGQYGSDSFTLQVTDGVKPVNIQYSVSLYIVKDNGTIVDHTISTGSTFDGQILTTAQNVTLAYSVTTSPKKGTVNIDSASGKYTYSAGTGYAGSDSFVVTVNYGYGSYTKTINVYLDTAPDVSAITTHVTTNQGVSYTGSVQATDIDAGTTLAYSVSEEPTKGSVTLNEHTGGYSYVPLAASAGDDHFTADVTDGTNTVHVVVYIHIETAISTSSTINKVTSQNTSVSGTINATDADGDPLSYSLSSSASHGVASVEATTGKYVYIPNTNYYGSDSFVIKVDDGTSPVLVTVNVKVNQKPTTNAPTQSFTTKGQAISGNANCSDPDGDALTYSISVQPTQGSVILDASTGAFAYTPNSGAAGNDTFKITATDGCDDIVVTVVVHNETDLVVASQASDLTVNQGKSTTGQLSASDADGDALAYSVSAQPAKGTLALNENTGAWTYLANSDAKGTDSFTISVTDGNVAKSFTYNLTINTPAEFSSSSKTSVATNQGENYTDSVSATDPDGDKLTYSVVQQGSKGTVTINPDTGRYVYVPTAGAAGNDTFVLGVSDGNFVTELTVKIHIETPITIAGDTQKAETSEGDERQAQAKERCQS
jgi:hypothetical protein